MIKDVLIVEDDPELRTLLVRFLFGSEFRVTEAATIKDALEMVQQNNSFDVFVLDFWLGGQSALPILDHISQYNSTALKVLISGGDGSLTLEATKAIGELSGAVRFLQKPFSKADFLTALSTDF